MGRGESGRGMFSSAGLTDGEAVRVARHRQTHRTLSDDTTTEAIQVAMAISEVSATLGITCTTSTAGFSGTLPDVIASPEKWLNSDEDILVRFLFIVAGFDWIIADHAGIAGVTGGCRAEMGGASVMRAVATVGAAGGTPQRRAETLSVATSNLLDLVYDPIAGLVGAPCVKRSTVRTTNTLASADLALVGYVSVIPADECTIALDKVGKSVSATLYETGIGGLTGTSTGQAIKTKIFGKDT